MAPETLTHDASTLASDRWSFGIVLWEAFSFGERPYAGMKNKEILGHIKAGNRLAAPPKCTASCRSAGPSHVRFAWPFGGSGGLEALLGQPVRVSTSQV